MMFATPFKSHRLAFFGLHLTVPSTPPPLSNTYAANSQLCSLNLYAQFLPNPLDKSPNLRKFLKDHPGPTLIYVTLQKVGCKLQKGRK